MKKLLLTIFLSFFLSGNAFADCKSDIKFKFTVNNHSSLIPDYRNIYMRNSIGFWFSNPSSKTIRISYVALKTKEREIIVEEDNQDLILNPFTKNQWIGVKQGRLMVELAKFGSYVCEYVAAGTTSTKGIYKDANDLSKGFKIKPKSNKSPNVGVVPDSASIWLWIGLGIAFVIIFMMSGSLDNKSPSKKNSKKVNKMKNNVVKILATLGLIVAIALILRGVFDIGLTLF